MIDHTYGYMRFDVNVFTHLRRECVFQNQVRLSKAFVNVSFPNLPSILRASRAWDKIPVWMYLYSIRFHSL